MAKERGWWELKVDVEELSDEDRNHIAHLIQEGYWEGEIVKNED